MAEGVKRRLSAILSADVVGYSRLMEEDEVVTVQTMESYRETVSSLIEQHNGRVVDSPGDNLLAEFGSVVDAVQCAVEIQHVIRAKNVVVPEARRMEFRIGISLEDVIEEEDRIYGDGVNIASRIEGLADAGGICISGAAYEQIKRKLALGYEDLGEHSVKNISWPVQVYRIPLEPSTRPATTRDGSAHSSEKPSIAVLPFDNMSGDPEQEYFSDGITDEIITRLSMDSGLTVIARNSSFFYKGKPLKIREVGHELGVGYIVEGSVRKAGSSIRITAQLIDARTEGNLWAGKYDREYKDIFALQDEIAHQIVVSMSARGITVAERARAMRVPTENLTAYDAMLRGWSYTFRYTKEDNIKAIEMFERAINLDPGYAYAYAGLSGVYYWDHMLGGGADPHALERVFESARKAVSLDDTIAFARMHLALAYGDKGQYEQAVAEADRAIALNPNETYAYLTKGMVLTAVGRPEEGVEHIRKGMHLNPHYTFEFPYQLARAYRRLGRYKEAAELLEEALVLSPDMQHLPYELSPSYRLSGQYEKSIALAKDELARKPEETWPVTELAWGYLGAQEAQKHGEEALDKALAMAEKGLALTDDSPWSHLALSFCYLLKGDFDKATSGAERAIDIAPNMPEAQAYLAIIAGFEGRQEDAVRLAKKVLELNPNHIVSLRTLGIAHRLMGNHKEAETIMKRALALNPHYLDRYHTHIELAILYAESGRIDKAKAEAAEVLELVPRFSVEVWGERNPVKDREQVKSDMSALRKAGLKWPAPG
jgi:adenylate cyclase